MCIIAGIEIWTRGHPCISSGMPELTVAGRRRRDVGNGFFGAGCAEEIISSLIWGACVTS